MSFLEYIKKIFKFFFKQAFPSISTGIYSYPIHEAIKIAFDAVKEILDSQENVNIFRFILKFYLRKFYFVGF